MIDLTALVSLLDDEVLVRKYLQRFNEDMPVLLRKIRAASDTEQWSEISIHAHIYKSQMQYLNEKEATGIAFELEKKSAVVSPEKDEIDLLITQLEILLKDTLEDIRKIIG